jgi:hypothetical protein
MMCAAACSLRVDDRYATREASMTAFAKAWHGIGPASAGLFFESESRTARHVITAGSQVREWRG